MNLEEYRRALDALSDQDLANFKQKLDTCEWYTREQCVQEFSTRRDLENRICYLLHGFGINMPTEAEKSVESTRDAARTSKLSAVVAVIAVVFGVCVQIGSCVQNQPRIRVAAQMEDSAFVRIAISNSGNSPAWIERVEFVLPEAKTDEERRLNFIARVFDGDERDGPAAIGGKSRRVFPSPRYGPREWKRLGNPGVVLVTDSDGREYRTTFPVPDPPAAGGN